MKGVSEKGPTGKEEGRNRTVGGLEKIKDVVRTVLQSGPLRLRAVHSNFVFVRKCNGRVSCSVGIAFGHWPGTVKEKKKHHLHLV